MPDVRDWEPRAALVGTGVTEAVARGAAGALAPGGGLVLEVGDGQAADAWPRCSTGSASGTSGDTRDLAGRDRVVEGRR